jgi:hypothetical protein
MAWVPLLRTFTGSVKVVVETIEEGLNVTGDRDSAVVDRGRVPGRPLVVAFDQQDGSVECANR